MRNINLVIFNESYWDKGLIYTQNILPLLKLSKRENNKIRIISFTSIVKYFQNKKEREIMKRELTKNNITLTDLPIFFYPTRYMRLQWYLIPYFYINVILYFILINIIDFLKKDKPIYTIRSYEAALGFLTLYFNKNNLVFDPRTDWIIENTNIGLFKENGLTYKYWVKKEKQLLQKFRKTLFISDSFRDSLMKRHELKFNEEKYCILYNPINYKLFENNNNVNGENFLYTGSLGHWNRLETYLDFFISIQPYFPQSNLIICTNTPERKVLPVLNDEKYENIREHVKVHFNVPTNKLPEYYSCCSYGLQLMNKRDSRVGVKFIEYIASGIIPIVNTNVEGAAYLSRKYDLGMVMSSNENIDAKDISEKLKRCSIDTNSQKYKCFKQMTDLNGIENILIKIYNF